MINFVKSRWLDIGLAVLSFAITKQRNNWLISHLDVTLYAKVARRVDRYFGLNQVM